MICPNCSKEIKLTDTSCPYCKEVIMEEVVENWKAEIDRLVSSYEEHGKGLVHGLQKDVIQNGWGHKLHKKEKNWKFIFKLIKWKKDEYLLTMTDIGGYGLTGKNMRTDEIPDDLLENERLARFEHMYFSGGATQGAGLFGRGKLIFTAASKDYYIIYDSLTHDGIYRLNRRKLEGRKLKNFAQAYEGKDAELMLEELLQSQLKPLKSSGTRVTIVNPKDEVVEAINDGTFLKYIEETWWQILQKSESAQIGVETEKGTQYAEIPKEFRSLPTTNTGKWKAKRIQPLNIEYEGVKKIKKVHFVVSPESVPPETRGVYLYRREMKVADLELRNIPDEIIDKFYGYVEIETKSEFENKYLEEKIEGSEHYSINKSRGLVRALKKVIQLEFEKFKGEIGYGVNETRLVKEKERRILKEALDEFNQRMNKLGISVGKFKVMKDIKISLEDIQFPSHNNLVNIGDEIKHIKYKIENKSDIGHHLNISILTAESNGKEIENIFANSITLNKQESKTIGPFSFSIKKELYPVKGAIYLLCVVKNVENNKTIAKKNILIFIGEVLPNIPELVEIELEKMVFPRGWGNKRVNYGESIKNIIFNMINNSNENIKVRFKVRVLDDRTKNVIESLVEKDLTLEPLKEEIIDAPNIEVCEEKYNILDRGKGLVIIRATVVALEDSPTGSFSKADKLAKSDIRFWVNMDSGKGVFEEAHDFEGGITEPRSKIQAEGQGFVFLRNITHPAYENIEETNDESAMRTYTDEQLLRQTLYLLLLTGKIEHWPEITGKNYKTIIEDENSEKYEIVESCLNTIDYLYAEYLK